MPPEFLSTHPNYDTRQRNIESWLPEALRHYRADAAAPVSVLPSLSATAVTADGRDAALHRYARAIDRRAAGRPGPEVVLQAMATVFEVPRSVVAHYVRSSQLGVGAVAVAMALSKAGAGEVAGLVAARARGDAWGTLAGADPRLAERALMRLREVLIEARRSRAAPRSSG